MNYSPLLDMVTIYGNHIWVCLKIVNAPKPNGFADPYPVLTNLYINWEY